MKEDIVKFDVVTVVFEKEIPLLRLQAISIREFFPKKNLGKILIVVNDIDEHGCIESLEKMLPEYGDFRKRVEIIRPDEILRPPRTMRDRFLKWRVGHSFFRKRRINREVERALKSNRGWNGNRGWACQQAFKLLSVSKSGSDYVLILDAKNWFTRPLRTTDFIDSEGMPLTYLTEPNDKLEQWVCASFAVLGGAYDGAPAPPTTTPCIYKRAFLVEAVNYLEEKLGPLEYFFCKNRRGATEFMLLWAVSEIRYGGLSNLFSEGLAPCLATFRSSNKDRIENRLKQLDNNSYFCAAIHRESFQVFSDDQSRRLTESWVKKGFFSDAAEAKLAFNEMNTAKDQRNISTTDLS